jgi:integrase
VGATDVDDTPNILFGQLATMWETDYVERSIGGRALVAASTKQKYRGHLHKHILPRWRDTPIANFRAKEVLDWLQQESGSWYMMTDLRNIMSGIFTKAQEWEVLPDTFANPISRVKLPKKWQVYEKRILTEDESVRTLARLKDPNRLICELCLATGARISEVTGLQIKHVFIEKGLIRIEQRHWRGDIDSPKTERSRRTLTLGNLTDRVRLWIDALQYRASDGWLFLQYNVTKPMWDSGVRAALKEAAAEHKCDFPGFGLHSLRRANITWRQEVGGSSIEASRIAGHASTKMTEEYTLVQLNRQEELTRRIQQKLVQAQTRVESTVDGQNCLASTPIPSDQCDRSNSVHDERNSEMEKKVRTKQNGAPAKQKVRTQKSSSARKDTKQATILKLLHAPIGATMKELMAATAWQLTACGDS